MSASRRTPDQEERDALFDEISAEISAHMDAGCTACKQANAAVGEGADPQQVMEMRCVRGSAIQRRAVQWVEEAL